LSRKTRRAEKNTMLTERGLIRRATTRIPSLRERRRTRQSRLISGKCSTSRIKWWRSRTAKDVRRIGKIARRTASNDYVYKFK